VKTILITGGTGLIGSHLAPLLKEKGYRLHLLSRSDKPVKGWDASFSWNPSTGEIDEKSLTGVTDIIHLAGAGIVDKRWTTERKRLIVDSRVKTAQLLYNTIKKQNIQLESYVSGSAIGWYGARTDSKIHSETESAYTDFMGETCRLWENSADLFENVATRVVKIRTGIVLAKESGALPQLAKPIQLFIGAPLGSGKQQIPWIHIEDVCRIFCEAIENPRWNGPFNASATENCSNAEFSEALAEVLNRKLLPVHVPALLLKIILGESSAAVLEGSRVSTEKLRNLGFRFKYPDLIPALKNLMG
jgi:uncharacterized protein (TIGR01777 family)